MKNWLREIPAVVRTSRETGEKNTSPLSREVRSSASVFSFAFILIHLVIFGFNIRNKQCFHEVRKNFFFICTALFEIDPEFQSQIPPLTDDEFKQLEENILKEGKLLSPLIVWNNTLVDGHNRYAILQKHPEIYFSTMPLPFESREEVLAWICKNQLGRRNLTPEQKKFLIGKQYSVEHRKPGGNGNNQHTAAAKKTAPEELCQIDTIPPASAESSIRKQIAERNNVSESYVARSEKFMRGVEIMEQMMPGMQEKILSGQFKVRDADMHRLARADFPNRKQIVHEILHPEDRPAPQSSYSHYSGINYSALEVAVRRIQQDFDFLMRYLPKLPDDSYAKTETLKIPQAAQSVYGTV